ncbi:MAG TPA: hypothetical protein H9870_01795 [Candidatus Corynebacterium avicola]|uniref:Transglycosylase SLT domain-containing protein n=1 Tax=Candidatus Corynebacterium avicola TaxID=2838527 RepID=A0A9D1RPM5_9CORY|nr:hypothetical protein [Candidatus Corynebacterium avicola]
MTEAYDRPSAGGGCARLLGLVVTVLLVVVLVGVFMVNEEKEDEPAERVPVPDDVPPAAAARVHDVPAMSQKLSIPEDYLEGYAAGAAVAADEMPQCHITWNTLAGIGYVESHHGTYGGGTNGDPIIGPRLDGSGEFMKVPDTDNGEIDGDTEYDRAVGPMQFLPDSWRLYGADGDPHDIADAAAASARLLCTSNGAERDMSTPEGWSEALHSYNRSEQYMIDVRDAAANYALGQSAG